MVTFPVSCPQCHATYQVRAEHVGKKARCAKCNTTFIVQQPEARPACREPEGLVACRFCGFQDSGNFCSNCGGRLTGSPEHDFERCKVPDAFFRRFPADFTIDLFRSDPKQQEEHRRQYEIRQRCERFNAGIEEMARQVKYEGAASSDWHFRRPQVGRMVDELPAEVPGREAIIASLWTIVSDIERAARDEQVREALESIEAYLADADVKLARKEINGIEELLKQAPDPALARMVDGFRERIRAIDQDVAGEKQIAAFRKVLDKADKLAFQEDWKKATKAYQECLFWLSRNEMPNKEAAEHDVREKLAQVQSVSA